MNKIIVSIVFFLGSLSMGAQCNGEFSLSGNQPFQKFTNGSQIQMSYCGDKGNLHDVMNKVNGYKDNLKFEVENDPTNGQLYQIVVTVKDDNSGQYAMKCLMALGINNFYFEGKKVSTDKAESIFK